MQSIIHDVVQAAHRVYSTEFGNTVTVSDGDQVRTYKSKTNALYLREDLDAGTFVFSVETLTGEALFVLNGFDASERARSNAESLAEYLRFMPDQNLRDGLSLAVLAFFEAQEGLTFRDHAALLGQFCVPIDQAA